MTPTKFLFIDARVQQARQITQLLDDMWSWAVLAADADGLDQMRRALDGQSGLQAIHVISHGEPGALILGSTRLDGEHARSSAELLSQIGQTLSPGADLLLYGCSVGAGAEGEALVELLARLTRADVAASEDATGSAALGGNLRLEVFVGNVESAPLSLDSLNELLVDTTSPTVTTFSPADEAAGVAVGANIVLTFSEPIQRGTGQIVLKTAAGATVATYDAAASANLSISGNTLTIDPTVDLNPGTAYRMEFAEGSLKDTTGLNWSGLSSLNFTTGGAVVLPEPTFAEPLIQPSGPGPNYSGRSLIVARLNGDFLDDLVTLNSRECGHVFVYGKTDQSAPTCNLPARLG